MSILPTTDQALEELFRRDGARLWRALLAYGGDREVASDALGEAFAQALARGRAIRDVQRWVWATAFRIAAGDLKERGRRRPLEGQVDIESSYEMADPADELLAALATLSPRQRAAIVLCYYTDRSPKEAARILGSSPAAIRVHLSQARKRLRVALESPDG